MTIAVIAAVTGLQSTGTIAMAQSTLESSFHDAANGTGEAYLAARKAIDAHGPEALVVFDEQRRSQDWRTVLTAEILTARLKAPEVFGQCHDAVWGKLVGPPQITSTFPPPRRIRELQYIGPVAAFCLLEMAWKTHEFGGPQERESIFGALAVLKNVGAVPPLIELLNGDGDPDIAMRSASVLGALKDARAIPPLLAELGTTKVPPQVRAAAALSLGSLKAGQAASKLREIAADEHADVLLRKSAVRALGELGDAGAVPGLLHLLKQRHELTFELTVLEVAGRLGGHADLDPLAEIEARHPEEPVREAAKEAAGEIKARASEKRE
jgi:hypothetical protein